MSHVVVGLPQPSELATIAQLHNRFVTTVVTAAQSSDLATMHSNYTSFSSLFVVSSNLFGYSEHYVFCCRPAVVLSSWLLDCCRRNKKLSENDYKLEANQEESATITTTDAGRKRLVRRLLCCN